MARAYRGPYARPSQVHVPYATAAVWGTGVDPIHSYYGEGPPLRVLGRHGHIGSSPVANDSPRDRDYQVPVEGNAADAPQDLLWGYPGGVDYSPDSFGAGADSPISEEDTGWDDSFFMGDHPSWNEPTEQMRLRSDTGDQTRWGRSGERFRAIRDGAHRYRANPDQILPGAADAYRPISAEPTNSNPTETVSEGWINKGTSFVADANPSADEQIFVQTSMRQRYEVRNNMRAQMRGTDEMRARIPSRVMAMIEKVYSTGERNYDMFPYQQDEIRRPFRTRTAGVGPAEWMQTNEYGAITPVIRTPPPDPAQGVNEVQYPDEYGYTQEDTMFYAG